jgi:tRNA threonylcarbamoyladenosine biosynthesis protein TsaE
LKVLRKRLRATLLKSKQRSDSAEATMLFAQQFGEALPKGSVVCLFGDLAAGKTTFVKGLAKGVGGVSPEEVNSPTYAYLNIYDGTLPIYHFDLYRIDHPEEFIAMGFDEYLYGEGISCVEWSENIEEFLPKNRYEVTLSHIKDHVREITIDEIV